MNEPKNVLAVEIFKCETERKGVAPFTPLFFIDLKAMQVMDQKRHFAEMGFVGVMLFETPDDCLAL